MILILGIGFATFKYIGQQKAAKPQAATKDEIKARYIQRISSELEALEGNSEAQREAKSRLLKEINSELSCNIYFDKDEVRELLRELAQL